MTPFSGESSIKNGLYKVFQRRPPPVPTRTGILRLKSASVREAEQLRVSADDLAQLVGVEADLLLRSSARRNIAL
eukprot:6188090-Pleurochrysis_carterae.AAC.5